MSNVILRCDSSGDMLPDAITITVDEMTVFRHRCDSYIFYFKPGDDLSNTCCVDCKRRWPIDFCASSS